MASRLWANQASKSAHRLFSAAEGMMGITISAVKQIGVLMRGFGCNRRLPPPTVTKAFFKCVSGPHTELYIGLSLMLMLVYLREESITELK